MSHSGLKYPSFDIRLKKVDEKSFLFDVIRKKWILLTPEEWVRQHYIHYLIKVKSVPASLISVEKQIKLNNITKRYDLVVFGNNRLPLILIECKSPEVAIEEMTAEQALTYNLVLNVKYLVLTNGITEIVIYCSDKEKIYLSELPKFSELV